MGPPVLAVTLLGPKDPQRVAMPIPIKIEVRNLSQQSVWIVGVVDGSEQGIRYPHYLPRIALGDEVVAEPPPPEDPLVGPLRLVDFRLLAPGEAFDPTSPHAGATFLPISTFSTFQPAGPGRYEFDLTLSTQRQYPEQWLGYFGQDAERSAVLQRIAQVPRLTVRSNILEVEVLQPSLG
jgi:hypothetical protein